MRVRRKRVRHNRQLNVGHFLRCKSHKDNLNCPDNSLEKKSGAAVEPGQSSLQYTGNIHTILIILLLSYGQNQNVTRVKTANKDGRNPSSDTSRMKSCSLF